MKEKNLTKKIILGCMMVLLTFTLFGCGSKTKKVDGYYTMTVDAQVGMGHDHYAIEINGSDVVYHTDRYGSDGHSIKGNIEYGDDGTANIYIPDINLCSYTKFCPLHVELSDDGKRMYLSSDNSDWNTDTYDVVSKADFDDFVEENFTDTVGETTESDSNSETSSESKSSEVSEVKEVSEASESTDKEVSWAAYDEYYANLSPQNQNLLNDNMMPIIGDAIGREDGYLDSDEFKNAFIGLSNSYFGNDEHEEEFVALVSNACKEIIEKNNYTTEDVSTGYYQSNVDGYKDITNQLFRDLTDLQ